MEANGIIIGDCLDVMAGMEQNSVDLVVPEHRSKRMPRDVVEDSRVSSYERTNIWHVAPSRHPLHPATFPPKLAERLITLYSFRGDTVLDPFAGSGTTLRAARRLGRRAVGIEVNPGYVEAPPPDGQAVL